MELYHKINSIQKRYTEGPEKGRFTGEWARPEFEYLQDNPWIWREKIDGTNIRVNCTPRSNIPEDGFKITYGGRTDNAQTPQPLMSRLQDIFEPAGVSPFWEAFQMDTLMAGVTLFGEGFGAGIQKGGHLYGPVDFILFDVKVGNFWLFEDDVTNIADKLGVLRVPIVGSGTLRDAIDLVRFGSLKSDWPDVEPEGLVVVPQIPLFDRQGHRVITKIKGVDFK